MKMSHAIAALLASSLLLSACGKTEQAPESEQAEGSSQQAPMSAEQASAIASLDQPNYDRVVEDHSRQDFDTTASEAQP